MTVIRCTTSDTPILYAVLWEGSDSLPSLDAISGFQDCPHTVSGNDLHIRYPGEYGKVAEPGKHYVLRGTTGHFFIVTKEEFESIYTPVGKTPCNTLSITVKLPSTFEEAQKLADMLRHADHAISTYARERMDQYDAANAELENALDAFAQPPAYRQRINANYREGMSWNSARMWTQTLIGPAHYAVRQLLEKFHNES